MKFYSEKDLTDENFEKFCQEIEDLHQKAKEDRLILSESPTPKFNTMEEALSYYHKQGYLTFEEWENKMRERHGLQ